MKKISKKTGFKFLSILIFSVAIWAVLSQKIGVGYSLIILGYCLLRKSDLEG